MFWASFFHLEANWAAELSCAGQMFGCGVRMRRGSPCVLTYAKCYASATREQNIFRCFV